MSMLKGAAMRDDQIIDEIFERAANKTNKNWDHESAVAFCREAAWEYVDASDYAREAECINNIATKVFGKMLRKRLFVNTMIKTN